jgi:hypothetical protein
MCSGGEEKKKRIAARFFDLGKLGRSSAAPVHVSAVEGDGVKEEKSKRRERRIAASFCD